MRAACEKKDFGIQGPDFLGEGLKPAAVPDVHGKSDCKRGSGCGFSGLGDGIVGDVVLIELSFGEAFGVVDCCFDAQCAHRETHDGFLGGTTVYFDVFHDIKESVVFLGCLCI